MHVLLYGVMLEPFVVFITSKLKLGRLSDEGDNNEEHTIVKLVSIVQILKYIHLGN